MRKILFLFFLCSISVTSAGGEIVCQNLFGKIDINKSIRALAELRLSLDLSQATNGSTLSQTALKNDFTRKVNELGEYVTQNNIMSADKFKQTLTSVIKKLQNQNREEENGISEAKKIQQQAIENAAHGRQGIFNTIEPGEFLSTIDSTKNQIKIKKPYAMMSTLTSQIIWYRVAVLINEKLGGVKFPIEGLFPKIKRLFEDKVQMVLEPSAVKGDVLPVEYVSAIEVDTWIKGLNRLSELGEPVLEQIFVGHRQGDRYRLPKMAEFEFVMKSRGTDNSLAQIGAYLNTLTSNQRDDYKTPAILDGKEFYIFGNYSEWLEDRHPIYRSNRRTRYVNYIHNASELFTVYSKKDVNRSPSLGFRLIREVRKP